MREDGIQPLLFKIIEVSHSSKEFNNHTTHQQVPLLNRIWNKNTRRSHVKLLAFHIFYRRRFLNVSFSYTSKIYLSLQGHIQMKI